MPIKIKLKNSVVRDKVPLPADIDVGEVALNAHSASPAAYIKDNAGVVRRIAGVNVGTTATAAPTAGETWLDTTRATAPVLKVYDGTAWQGAGSGVTTGAAAPTAPVAGDLWVDTSVAGAPVLKVYNGTAFVPVAPVATTAAVGTVQLADAAAITAGTAGRVVDAAQLKAHRVHVGEAAPANPTQGQQWFRSSTGKLYVYYDDGTGAAQWVVANPQEAVDYTQVYKKTEADTKFVDVTGDTMTGDLTVPSLNGGQLAGMRNRIINGDMRMDQRNSGAAVTATAAGYNTYLVDRWCYNVSQASKFTAQQNAGSVTPPAGHTNYLGIISSSAYSALGTDYFLVGQTIEGFNAADLGWGAAGAQSITLSFWVRSSLTGTFGGALSNSAQNRSYPFTFAINSANTWEQKTLTIAGDTSGTWLKDNGIGIRVWFGLGAGSTYNGTAGAWAGATKLSATGATSVVGTNGATFYITGVQLEPGTVATPFERRPYGLELELCQRYYCKSERFGVAGVDGFPHISGVIWQDSGGRMFVSGPAFPVTMRAAPTVRVSGVTTGTVGNVHLQSSAINVVLGGVDIPVQALKISNQGFNLDFTAGPPSTLGRVVFHWEASIEL